MTQFIQQIRIEGLSTILLNSVCVLLFYLIMKKITKLVIGKTPGYEKESQKNPVYLGIVFILMSSLLIVFGWSIEFLKGIILLEILLYASVSDIQTHEVKDLVSILLFITGFIGVCFTDIPMMFLSGFIIGSMLLICAMVSGNRLGGADIKISAACAFLLGFPKCIVGLIIGLFLAIIINMFISYKCKTKGKAFPLVPYLSIGFMAVYFI